jgi:hypothetical protein
MALNFVKKLLDLGVNVRVCLSTIEDEQEEETGETSEATINEVFNERSK